MRTREGEEVRIVRTDRGGVHQKVAHPPDKVAPYWWYHIDPAFLPWCQCQWHRDWQSFTTSPWA